MIEWCKASAAASRYCCLFIVKITPQLQLKLVMDNKHGLVCWFKYYKIHQPITNIQWHLQQLTIPLICAGTMTSTAANNTFNLCRDNDLFRFIHQYSVEFLPLTSIELISNCPHYNSLTIWSHQRPFECTWVHPTI